MSLQQELETVAAATAQLRDDCNAVLGRHIGGIEVLAELPSRIEDTYQYGYTMGNDEGEQRGRESAEQEFWDPYQKGGLPANYLYAFAGLPCNEECYNPQYPIVIDTNGLRMFSYSNITDTKVTIDASTLVSNVGGMFEYSKLQTIRKLIWNSDNPMVTQFTGCTKLQNITIEGILRKDVDFRWCPLSRESIENVMAALSDTVTGQTATFNKAAAEAAFSADEWAALVASKPNWAVVTV